CGGKTGLERASSREERASSRPECWREAAGCEAGGSQGTEYPLLVCSPPATFTAPSSTGSSVKKEEEISSSPLVLYFLFLRCPYPLALATRCMALRGQEPGTSYNRRYWSELDLLVEKRCVLSHQGGTFLRPLATGHTSLRIAWVLRIW